MKLGDGLRDEFYFENKTWSLIDLPLGKKLINAQWVYKIKPSFDGKPNKLKAWLVAKRYEQRPRIDFNKTFMLVIHSMEHGKIDSGVCGSQKVGVIALGCKHLIS